MLRKIAFFLFLTFVFVGGCATVPDAETGAAIHKTPLQGNQIETRQDIKEAVEKIADTVGGRPVRVKYCPVCGRHYDAGLEFCTKDGALLKEVQE